MCTTVAAVAVVGIALLVGGVSLVAVTQRSLLSGVDDAARARARDVAALAAGGGLPATLADTGEETALVQVVDRPGRVLTASANLEGEDPVAPFGSGAGSQAPRTVRGLPVGDDSDAFRVVTLTTDTPGGPVAIHVAVSLAAVQRSVRTLTAGLLVGGPALLALVGATGLRSQAKEAGEQHEEEEQTAQQQQQSQVEVLRRLRLRAVALVHGNLLQPTR